LGRRFLLWAASVVLAASVTIATPAAASATGGIDETGAATYRVMPAQASIHVSIELTIRDTALGTEAKSTEIRVELEAGSVTATSDGGAVTQAALEADRNFRYIQISYPAISYGETRIVDISYSIPAAPHSSSPFRAGQAYASLCAVGSGADTGSVSVVLPTGFRYEVVSGSDLPDTSQAVGTYTLSSGSVSDPRNFWTCVAAEDPAKLTNTPVTAGDQSFTVQSWPEDQTWARLVTQDVSGDVARLEEMTGYSMPGGTIQVQEIGGGLLGGYDGYYVPSTRTLNLNEELRSSTVAHELSHIWFNGDLFADVWMAEGFAGYSEKAAGPGNYKACDNPGAYPGAGSPNLTSWVSLDANSTTQDSKVLLYQYAAACFVVTTLADAMGPDNYRAFLAAVKNGEIAYVGAGAPETHLLTDGAVSAQELLDLADERGLVPAGVGDLDKAQKLMAKYGIVKNAAILAARSHARATYHQLAAAAKTWKMPFAVREPMAAWGFDTAETAMGTIGHILDLRGQIEASAGFTLDGTAVQQQFEQAQSQTDLDQLATFLQQEADAAAKVDQANKLYNGNRDLLQSLGLMGTDLLTPLNQARTDLVRLKPDDASSSAQVVIDTIKKSSDKGLALVTTAFVSAIGVLGLILLIVLVFALRRRRRRPAAALAAGGWSAGWAGGQTGNPGWPGPGPWPGPMPWPGQMPGPGQIPGQMPWPGPGQMPGQMSRPGPGPMPWPGQIPGQMPWPGPGQMPVVAWPAAPPAAREAAASPYVQPEPSPGPPAGTSESEPQGESLPR